MTTAHPAEFGQQNVQWAGDRPMAPRLELIFPWLVSFTLHMGMMLVVIAMFYFGVKKTIEEKNYIMPIGEAWELDDGRPPGSPNPGTLAETSDAAQDKFTEASDGWAEAPNGDSTDNAFSGEGAVTDLVSLGMHGQIGGGDSPFAGVGGGKLAPYGVRGGGSGTGPRGVFCCCGLLNSNRVVYVLDHSGSMVDSFDHLRAELKKSISHFTPAQSFAVVMLSEKVDATFPKEEKLINATPAVKHDLVDFVDNIRAAGKNDDLYEPFAHGLRRAFALKPQTIFFLTDGNFDPRVVEEARRLNTDKCKINTLAFLKVSKEAEEGLKTMAADSNGGKFRFVTEADLEK